MKIKYIADLEFFVLLTKYKNLTAAAAVFDISISSASVSLRRLENDLGIPLFVRTTRHMRLTKDGERFLEYCRQVLETLEEAEKGVASARGISGLIQIAMPSDIGRQRIVRWLDEFQTKYPSLTVRLELSDRAADLAREPIDLALQYGTPLDSSMVAAPLFQSNSRVLCASPSYIAQYGAPATPEELKERNCLIATIGDEMQDRWLFRRGNEEISVRVKGNRIANDSDAVRRWAIEGHGICYRSYLDVTDDLQEGRLVRVCEDWQGEPAPLYLISVARKQISAKARAVREFLQSKFSTLSPSHRTFITHAATPDQNIVSDVTAGTSNYDVQFARRISLIKSN